MRHSRNSIAKFYLAVASVFKRGENYLYATHAYPAKPAIYSPLTRWIGGGEVFLGLILSFVISGRVVFYPNTGI